jgi:hypothetical protein
MIFFKARKKRTTDRASIIRNYIVKEINTVSVKEQ